MQLPLKDQNLIYNIYTWDFISSPQALIPFVNTVNKNLMMIAKQMSNSRELWFHCQKWS